MAKGKNWTRNQKILLGTLIIGALGLIFHFGGKKKIHVGGDIGAIGDDANVTIDKRTVVEVNSFSNQIGPNSTSQTVIGKDINQILMIDNSNNQSGGIHIERIESGAELTINIINYQDGVSKSRNIKVTELFQKANAHYAKKEYKEAIIKFAQCLEQEEDNEKRGAINLQIGNCYYMQKLYFKAAEFYADGLRESRKAKDLNGEASNIISLAYTYMQRPASSGAIRRDNVQKAVKDINYALTIFNKDEYPVEYAMAQGNLALAYRNLPAETDDKRAEHLAQAIKYCKTALEFCRKEEYPKEYAWIQDNLGSAYMELSALSHEDRTKDINQAIECYEAAIDIRKTEPNSFEYAKTKLYLGIAYIDLPTSIPINQVRNFCIGADCIQEANRIFKKEIYPLQYAMTQNSLGKVCMNMPVTTPEEHTKNIRHAIEYCQKALEIYTKDKYPQYYCGSAANLGMAFALVNDPNSCYWLKEAYALREYLDDQGKDIEKRIQQICKKETN